MSAQEKNPMDEVGINLHHAKGIIDSLHTIACNGHVEDMCDGMLAASLHAARHCIERAEAACERVGGAS